MYQFSSVQSLSHVGLFATPWTEALQASMSITNSWSLLKLMSIESLMPSNHLILSHPLLLLPSIFSGIRAFSNELVLRMRWPKDWSFTFNISLSNEHSGLISFRMDWLDLLAVQGTLKCLLQHHSSKRSLVLSLPYGPTLISIHDYWKIHNLDYFLPISEIVKSFSLYCLVWGPLATGVTKCLKCGQSELRSVISVKHTHWILKMC